MERNYDLRKRTSEFGKSIVEFCKDLPRNDVTRPLIDQLIRCGTSVGANYREADDAESKNDFKHKIGICKKETSETDYFLQMVLTAIPNVNQRCEPLLQEAQELNLIFNTIFKKLKQQPKIEAIKS